MYKLLPFLFTLLPFCLQAQYFEMGASVGGANYTGELAANSSTVYLKESNLAAGAFARYNIHPFVSLRLHAHYASISGRDANSDIARIQNRNLNFRSNIYELGLMGEFNILRYDPVNYNANFSPYLFGGIAFYQFNPQAIYNQQYYDLQPLGTEGQYLADYPNRRPYQLQQFAIPFGAGVKYALSESINIGVEIGARKLFTDYLDDVSLTYPNTQLLIENSDSPVAGSLSDRRLTPDNTQNAARGDNNATDWYFIGSFTISYNFSDSGLSGGRNLNRRGKSGCVSF